MKQSIIINIFIFFFIVTNIFSAGSDFVRSVTINKKVVISPKKIGTGKWKICYYDKNSLELIEKSNKPIPKFIFQAIKSGKTKVVIKYYESEKIFKKYKYIINISKYKKIIQKNKIKERKDFELNIDSKQKNNFINQDNYNQKNKPLYKKKSVNNKKNPVLENKIVQNSEIYYLYIIKLYNKKLYSHLIPEIDKFLSMYQNHEKQLELSLLKGKVYTELNMHSRAIKWYKKLIEINEDNFSNTGRIMILLGKAYERNNNNDKAKHIYVKVLTLYKNPLILAEAHYNLGNQYFKEKKYKKGIIEFNIIVDELPEASKKREMTLYLLGEMYYKKSPLRNYKKAYRCFKTLINEYPFGKYTKIAIKKMKYLEENYINYY